MDLPQDVTPPGLTTTTNCWRQHRRCGICNLKSPTICLQLRRMAGSIRTCTTTIITTFSHTSHCCSIHWLLCRGSDPLDTTAIWTATPQRESPCTKSGPHLKQCRILEPVSTAIRITAGKGSGPHTGSEATKRTYSQHDATPTHSYLSTKYGQYLCSTSGTVIL